MWYICQDSDWLKPFLGVFYVSKKNAVLQEAVQSVSTIAAAWSHSTERPILRTSGGAKERQRLLIIIYITICSGIWFLHWVFLTVSGGAEAGQVLQAVSVWWGVRSCLCSLWVWWPGAQPGTWKVKEVGACLTLPLPSARAPLVSSALTDARWQGLEAEVWSQSRWRSGCVGWEPGGARFLRLLFWSSDLQVWGGLSADGLGPSPGRVLFPLNRITDCQTSLTFHPRHWETRNLSVRFLFSLSTESRDWTHEKQVLTLDLQLLPLDCVCPHHSHPSWSLYTLVEDSLVACCNSNLYLSPPFGMTFPCSWG